MDTILRELLEVLELIGQTHKEIWDTVCREKMRDPITFMFIKPTPGSMIPDDFGLFSDDPNREVKAALLRYIHSAQELAAKQGITSFHQRRIHPASPS